jgi:hypothetical protein
MAGSLRPGSFWSQSSSRRRSSNLGSAPGVMLIPPAVALTALPAWRGCEALRSAAQDGSLPAIAGCHSGQTEGIGKVPA